MAGTRAKKTTLRSPPGTDREATNPAAARPPLSAFTPHPRRPSRPLLATSLVLFLAWLTFLLRLALLKE
jgi:hypothetical protein